MQGRDSLDKPHVRGISAQPDPPRPLRQSPPMAPHVLVPSVEGQHREDGAGSGSNWPISPEWALVWVTIILALYTYRLFRATNTLAQDARIASEKQAMHTEASIALARRSA